MDNKTRIIDLKKEKGFVEQYINLRNKYADLLLTSFVNVLGTQKWLNTTNAEIRGIVQNNVLCGVVILHLDKNAEIGFFVKYQNKGIGSKLLNIIEKVAKEKGLDSIWAWALEDNVIAQHVFEKNGFVKKDTSKREYDGMTKSGINYRKCLGNSSKV